MSGINFVSRNVEDTAALAAALAKLVRAGDCLALSGEVGAGKTTFTQSFLFPLLRVGEPITSPTFTLVQCYETMHPWHVYHADLYRLKHVSEFAELGLEDSFERHVTIIEWPEIAFSHLPEATLYITIEHRSGQERMITFKSTSAAWLSRLKELSV